ncbi:MAG: Holliday junction branch migration protein RuvA [Chitinispirillales bacterium]|jgi:Holliday junction DNA helicase RuvA|nr:Holliday junction branch migration protein RuvA [Chitinispirillales bacterium]
MIEYIRGVLADKEISRIAVEAAGVGYSVAIPLSTYEKLPDAGKEVKVFIHYHMREDDVSLYGFAAKSEREVFRHLITVNSIGPKVAMGIMSGISIENLATYVNTGNTAGLKKIPGVGAKTAERIIVELKGKLGMYASAGTATLSQPSIKIASGKATRQDEAFAAMMSLGYNDKQVAKAITRVEQEIGKDAPIEEWIRMALQVI